MLVPSVVTIEMQATRIRASMTAYSTAVGPSSLVRKRAICEVKAFIECFSFFWRMAPPARGGCHPTLSGNVASDSDGRQRPRAHFRFVDRPVSATRNIQTVGHDLGVRQQMERAEKTPLLARDDL